MEDLEGGVSSLWLGLGDGRIPVERLPDVLAESTSTWRRSSSTRRAVRRGGRGVRRHRRRARGVPADRELTGCLGADPLGLLARTGAEAATLTAWPLTAWPGAARPIPRSPRDRRRRAAFHDAGGTEAQELGCALAAGLEYLRAMRRPGLSAEAAFAQLEFRYAATADQFTTIAKLRAARRSGPGSPQQCGVASERWGDSGSTRSAPGRC